MKLKNQLILRLKHEDAWVNGANLERWEFRSDKGTLYKPSTIGRCLRTLAEEMPDRIERMIQGKSVAYRYIKSKYEQFHGLAQEWYETN